MEEIEEIEETSAPVKRTPPSKARKTDVKKPTSAVNAAKAREQFLKNNQAKKLEELKRFKEMLELEESEEEDEEEDSGDDVIVYQPKIKKKGGGRVDEDLIKQIEELKQEMAKMKSNEVNIPKAHETKDRTPNNTPNSKEQITEHLKHRILNF